MSLIACGNRRILSFMVVVVALVVWACYVPSLPYSVRPSAVVSWAYVALALAALSVTGRLIRNVATSALPSPAIIGTIAAYGIMTMGYATFEPYTNRQDVGERISGVVFGGIVGLMIGVLPTLAAGIIAWVACAAVGINDQTRPVHCAVIGFFTGALSPSLFVFVFGVGLPEKGHAKLVLPAMLVVSGYFGARAELVAYAERRSQEAIRSKRLAEIVAKRIGEVGIAESVAGSAIPRSELR